MYSKPSIFLPHWTFSHIVYTMIPVALAVSLEDITACMPDAAFKCSSFVSDKAQAGNLHKDIIQQHLHDHPVLFPWIPESSHQHQQQGHSGWRGECHWSPPPFQKQWYCHAKLGPRRTQTAAKMVPSLVNHQHQRWLTVRFIMCLCADIFLKLVRDPR